MKWAIAQLIKQGSQIFEIKPFLDEVEIMLKLVKEVAPVLFKNAGAPCTVTGKCPEGSMSCKNPRK